MNNATPIAFPTRRTGPMDALIRRAVLSKLEGLSDGSLALVEGVDRRQFGTPGADGLQAVVHVDNPRLYRRLMFGGALGAAESYLDGDWTTDDLTAVIQVFARNLTPPPHSTRPESPPAACLTDGAPPQEEFAIRIPTQHRWHHDLGNEFFELFLDSSMTYSCGIFATPESTLLDASIEKYDTICRKLGLRESDHLVEIGCGWGGFAIHAASRYGCRVTATTISGGSMKPPGNVCGTPVSTIGWKSSSRITAI